MIYFMFMNLHFHNNRFPKLLFVYPEMTEYGEEVIRSSSSGSRLYHGKKVSEYNAIDNFHKLRI